MSIYRIEDRIPGPIPFTKVPASMYAIREGNEVILIDPFLVSEADTQFLEHEIGTPTLILISVETHVRDAAVYRQRYGAEILANRTALLALKIAVDDVFDDGDKLPGGLTAIGLPGLLAGETAFWKPGPKPRLFVADALFNLRVEQIGCFPGLPMILIGYPIGLGIIPRIGMRDSTLARESYRKLLDYNFDQLLLAHSDPILSGAKEQLERVLAKASIFRNGC